MAEQDTLAEQARARIARWYLGALSQIAAWHERWDHTFKMTRQDFGMAREWQGPGQGFRNDPERFQDAVRTTQGRRAWLAASDNTIENIQARQAALAEA